MGNQQQATNLQSPASLGDIQGMIPQPSGFDENGQPFWEINGQQVYWPQLQQILWQKLQQQQSGNNSKNGPEQMPQMPNLPQQPVAPETNLETGPQLDIEASNENKVEVAPEQGDTSVNTKSTPTQQKEQAESFLGDSAKIQQVDPSDPQDMYTFVQDNQNGPKDSSNTFLAMLLRKLLTMSSGE